MNRASLGLAVGAGYVLGRTKKMKLAFAVGTLVAGKKLQLSPTAVLDLVRTRLDANPAFKEIGGQLREDFRGVGKAATGAILERQMEGLANRLHSRTAGVRDRIEGVAPDLDDVDDVADKATGGRGGKLTGRSSRSADSEEESDEQAQDADRPAPRKRTQARKSAASDGRKTAPRKRSQTAGKKAASSPAKKAAGTARRSPRGGAKGERGNG
ncbi:DNA primase [Streptomyces tropicalis]|uniref:DNA primase n=1 Tax=Streptomyces tropicalis TaxID=3034234 RepID=A0ABT6A4J4_9ACTN|nr:DNA primase [Streptomyces tropicalis]MDF3299547.1 DNA primase [Streptomyces tropicalis]